MALIYPPIVVVRTLSGPFLESRGLDLARRGLAGDGGDAGAAAAIAPPTDDSVISDAEQFGYVRIDAKRRTPRGTRDWVVILVLAPGGKYASHSPDLRALIRGVGGERAAKDKRLDQLIIVASLPFFGKKNMIDVLVEVRAKDGVEGFDEKGERPYFDAYPDYVFAADMRKNIAPHRVMSKAEVDEMLETERKALADLPVIFASKDTPIIWNGGRAGQVVEITRDSYTAMESIYWRRIERGPL